MKRDGILRHLTAEDIPEACAVLTDYLDIDTETLKREKFYVGDGLDMFRYLLKHLDGLEFKIPRLRTMQEVHKRYINERTSCDKNLSVPRLSLDTGLDERTIRAYLRELGE